MKSRAPVDEGWSWVCAFGSMLCLLTSVGANRSMGLLYVDIMKEFNASAGTVAMIYGCNMAMCLFGPVVGVLHDRFGARPVVAVGAGMQFIAVSLSSMAPNIYYVIALLGIVNGVGQMLMFCSGVGVVTQYFSRRRALATGIAMSGSSLGQLVNPVILGFWLKRYSLRGTLLLYGGIFAHGFISAALFRPASFYEPAKEFRKQEQVSHHCDNSEIRHGPTLTGHAEDASSCQDITCADDNTVDGRDNDPQAFTTINKQPLSTDSERSTSVEISIDHNETRAEIPVDNSRNNTQNNDSGVAKFFFECLPRSLILNPAFVVFLVGSGLGNCILFDSIILLPAMAEESGLDKDTVVWLMFFGGASEVASRVISGWLIDRLRRLAPPYYIGGGCCVLLALGTLRCVVTPNFRSIVVMCALQGALGGCLVVCVPTVLVELVGASQFARGFSLAAASGVVNAFVMRILGNLRDQTGDYRASYTLISALYSVPIIVYILVIPLILRCKKRESFRVVTM